MKTAQNKNAMWTQIYRAFSPSACNTRLLLAMLPVAMASIAIAAPFEDAAATVRHTSQLAHRPVTNPAVLAAAIPRVLLREGERPEWDTYLHAVYGEHPWSTPDRSLQPYIASEVCDTYLPRQRRVYGEYHTRHTYC